LTDISTCKVYGKYNVQYYKKSEQKDRERMIHQYLYWFTLSQTTFSCLIILTRPNHYIFKYYKNSSRKQEKQYTQ